MEKDKKIFNIVFNNFTNDSRVLKTSQTLGGAGYDVTVLAIHRQGLPERERGDLFAIKRIKTLKNIYTGNKIEKLIHYVIFLLKCTWASRAADYVHCNDLQALPVGVLLKLWRRKVVLIYDAHEHETETKNLVGLKKKIKKILEKSFIPFANKVIVVSNSIAVDYKNIYGIEKPKIIMNCPRVEFPPKSNVFRSVFGISDEDRIFLYQGGLSRGRGLNLILDAFEQVENATVVFMGYGEMQKEIESIAACRDNVFFFPAVGPEDLLRHTASADFGICLMEDVCLNHRYCLPNKLFEYNMAGLPSIVSNLPEMRKFVLDNGVGIVIEENSIDGLVGAINKAVSADISEIHRNINICRSVYCWENQEIELLNLYRESSGAK